MRDNLTVKGARRHLEPLIVLGVVEVAWMWIDGTTFKITLNEEEV